MSDSDKLMEYVSDYIEGNLPGDIRRDFEAQLQNDEELRGIVDRVRILNQRLPGMAKITSTAAFDHRLQESLRAERSSSSSFRLPWQGTPTNWRIPAYATAMVLILSAGFMLVDFSEETPLTNQPLQESTFAPNHSGRMEENLPGIAEEEAEALEDSLGNEPSKAPMIKKKPQLVNDRK